MQIVRQHTEAHHFVLPELTDMGAFGLAGCYSSLSRIGAIAIFKIKAYSSMNGTNLHSPVELQPEMHAESHLEEHPMSLL